MFFVVVVVSLLLFRGFVACDVCLTSSASSVSMPQSKLFQMWHNVWMRVYVCAYYLFIIFRRTWWFSIVFNSFYVLFDSILRKRENVVHWFLWMVKWTKNARPLMHTHQNGRASTSVAQFERTTTTESVLFIYDLFEVFFLYFLANFSVEPIISHGL